MPWARVDDQWWMHHKVLPLPMQARGLWVTALSYCGTSRSPDISDAWVRMVCGLDNDADQLAKMLVDAGLWDETDGGWQVHDWDQYQAKSTSEKRAEAGKVGGLTRALRAAEAEIEALRQQAEPQPEQANGKQIQANASSVQARASEPPKHGPVPVPVPTPVEQQPLGDLGSPVEAEDTVDMFADVFWPAYLDVARGRPTGAGARSKAERSFRRLSKTDRQAAVDSLDGYRKLLAIRDAGRSGPYPAKHGSTFLNERYFDDVARELESAQASVNGPRAGPPDMSRFCPCGQPLDQHDDDLCTERHTP